MLRLLLDEDSKSKTLVRLLTEAGHDVATTADLNLDGQPDHEVLKASVSENRVLLTRNCGDFLELHQQDSSHPGVLLVFQDPRSPMSFGDIARSIANLEAANCPLAEQCHVLNAWQF
ncbi:MAG: DUF5615 family PIN-like protein [Armatimonadetes bacterium]|nr:hypothetical protein [Armatimonadota bacterium]MBS1700491.1 DUF5615 family PIN-like protein [Armatimonadota bacterium]MBS1725246.1 DUF5615 family PIN-like protein [Armatimonadota bacterium]